MLSRIFPSYFFVDSENLYKPGSHAVPSQFGNFGMQMLWMMGIITLYAIAFSIFHSPTYGLVHLACWLAVPLLAMYNGQRGRLKWLGKFFYYYYPAHMALIGLLECFSINSDILARWLQ